MSARLYLLVCPMIENGKVSFLLKIPNTPYSFVLLHVHVQTTVSVAKEISRWRDGTSLLMREVGAHINDIFMSTGR